MVFSDVIRQRAPARGDKWRLDDVVASELPLPWPATRHQSSSPRLERAPHILPTSTVHISTRGLMSRIQRVSVDAPLASPVARWTGSLNRATARAAFGFLP